MIWMYWIYKAITRGKKKDGHSTEGCVVDSCLGFTSGARHFALDTPLLTCDALRLRRVFDLLKVWKAAVDSLLERVCVLFVNQASVHSQ